MTDNLFSWPIKESYQTLRKNFLADIPILAMTTVKLSHWVSFLEDFPIEKCIPWLNFKDLPAAITLS
jgi:hypothetical protein